MSLKRAHALDIRSLRKRFGDVVAVDGLDLQVGMGECFGLLGPNGAGKTTTIEICEGLLAPDSGDVTILGHTWKADGHALRQKLGAQLQESQFSDKLTVAETLALFRSFYVQGFPVDELIAQVRLEEKRHARVSELSGGQKQRLSVACALAGNPELVFLDEPTNGLDPEGRTRMLDLVLKVRAELDTSVVLASHLLQDVERVADQLVILDKGEVKAAGSMAGLRKMLARRFELRFLDPLNPEQEGELGLLGAVLGSRNGLYDLEFTDPDPAAAFRWAQARGATLVQLTPRHDRLDEVLIRALRPA